MSVRELIEMLQKFPPEAVVIHDLYSDYDELGLPTLMRAEDKKVIYRNGLYQRWYDFYEVGSPPPSEYPPSKIPDPVFVTVVHFAGN